MRILAFIFVLALTIAASPSRALVMGGQNAASLTCPNGTTFPDGCPGAATDGTFQISTAFQNGGYFNTQTASPTNFMAQNCSQQGVTVACRAPWNISGVDYPIGVQSSVTLQDPATANIPGCVFSTGAWGGNLYTCGGALFGAGQTTVTINGLELGSVTGAGAHGCTALRINDPASGVTGLVLKNIHFFNDTNLCSDNPPASSSTAIRNYSNKYTNGITLTQCDLNGNSSQFSVAVSPAPAWALAIASTAGTAAGSPFTVTYCHIHAFSGNMIFPIFSPLGSLTMKYNFIEDWDQRAPSGHTEWIAGGQGNAGIRGQIYQYNVVLQPWQNTQFGPAPVWYSSAWFNPQPIDLIDISNNTLINQWTGKLTVAAHVSGCMGGKPAGTGACDTSSPDGTFYVTAGVAGQGLNLLCGSPAQNIGLWEEIPGPYPPTTPPILDEFKMDNANIPGVTSSFWPNYTPAGIFCNAATTSPNQGGDAGVIDGHGGMLIDQVNIKDNWIDASSQAAAAARSLYLFVFDATTAITSGSVSGSTLTFTSPASITVSTGEAVVGTGIGNCATGTQNCPRILTGGTYTSGSNVPLDSSIPTPVSGIAINIEKLVQCQNPVAFSGNVDASATSYTDTFMNSVSPPTGNIPAIGC